MSGAAGSVGKRSSRVLRRRFSSLSASISIGRRPPFGSTRRLCHRRSRVAGAVGTRCSRVLRSIGRDELVHSNQRARARRCRCCRCCRCCRVCGRRARGGGRRSTACRRMCREVQLCLCAPLHSPLHFCRCLSVRCRARRGVRRRRRGAHRALDRRLARCVQRA
jgi:hypothetical protein